MPSKLTTSLILLASLTSIDTVRAQVRLEEDTRFGTAHIISPGMGDEKCLYFKGKLIRCSKQDHMTFGGKISTKSYDIIFINEDCGGSGCGHPSVSFLVTSVRDFAYNDSNRSQSWDRLKAKIQSDQDSFFVIAGPESGFVYRLSFQRGAFTYIRSQARSADLSESNCEYLYSDILSECRRSESNCKNPFDSMAMVYLRSYTSIVQQYHTFPRRGFEDLCISQCVTRNPLNRSSFESKFCKIAK